MAEISPSLAEFDFRRRPLWSTPYGQMYIWSTHYAVTYMHRPRVWIYRSLWSYYYRLGDLTLAKHSLDEAGVEDPGILPGSAQQCIFGNLHLRSDLSKQWRAIC